MTGPITFADKTAREQLIENGTVVTFRSSKRTTGKTWWKTSRLGEKEGDVVVETIAADVDVSTESEILSNWGYLSGFKTVSEWVDAIGEINFGEAENGILYRATLSDVDDNSPCSVCGSGVEFLNPIYDDQNVKSVRCTECGEVVEI